MNLIGLISGVLKFKKEIEIDVKLLPSQGLFYKDDFKLKIKRAEDEDILEYESNFDLSLNLVVDKVKKIVKMNTIFSSNYTFEDLKSIDVVYTFLEIVKFTKDKPIKISYYDKNDAQREIEFDTKNFNYYIIDDEIMKYYDNNNKHFKINNYAYTLPSIGVEICLTDYLIKKSSEPDSIKYTNYYYDFIYFLGNTTKLTFAEIDNLIQIFNYDLDQSELFKIKDIIEIFIPIQLYSLIDKTGRIVNINSMINLEFIWK